MEQAAALADRSDIATAIIASGIADEPVTGLVEGAMRRLVGAGVPLDRMQVGFRILHPLFDGMSITWTDQGGVEVSYYEKIDVDGSSYRLSPFYYMLSNKLAELRLRIDDEATGKRFPVLADLKARGFTDYLAMIVSFGGAAMTPEAIRGSAPRGRRGTLRASALPISPPCARCCRRSRSRSESSSRIRSRGTRSIPFTGRSSAGASCPG